MTRPPLDGVRVVSLAEQYPGPFATMLLADLGADVILVERPGTGDPTRAYPGFFDSMARGKRSIALDLKSGDGRAGLQALLETADVLIEGFRPGAMDRLGFSADTVLERRPQLLYVSISGFGQTGPNRLRAGHDLTYQAEAGMLYEHVPPAPPPSPPSLALGDLSAAMFAVQGVLAGLLRRERTGRGGRVDVAMVDCLATLLAAHAGPVLNSAGPPGFPYEPGYGVFVTADGEHLALGVAHEDHFWRALCDVTGLGHERDLAGPARMADHARLRELLAGAIALRTAEEWEQVLEAADVPVGRLRRLDELPAAPQFVARQMFTDATGPTGEVHVRQPLIFDGVAPGPTRGVPALGAHTVELLRECGIAETGTAHLVAAAQQDAPVVTAAPEVRDDGADVAWDEFGVYRVLDGVHRVPLALPDDGLRAVNVYVLDDPAGPVLIDPGQAIGLAREQLRTALAVLGHRLEQVQRSLVTHVHRDHYTQAVTLRREFGTRVGLGLGERESLLFVSVPGVHRLHAQLLMLREAGAADLAEVNREFDDGLPGDLWEEPDDWLVPDTELQVQARRLEVIETPGHTRGHVVFRDAAAGTLFAGDHVLPRITPSIGFEPVVPRLPLGDYLTSLRRVQAYPDTMLLPAHGPVTGSVNTRIDELLEHHAERLADSYAAVDPDHRTARAIAGRLTWTRRHRMFDTLHPGDQMLAVLETKAHLDVLVDRGRLGVGTDAGVTYYLSR